MSSNGLISKESPICFEANAISEILSFKELTVDADNNLLKSILFNSFFKLNKLLTKSLDKSIESDKESL